MLKKIKKYFADKALKKAKKAELDKYQKYYELLRSGQLFIDFVLQDIALSKKNHMNRNQRRRIEADIVKKGKITPEIVAHYKVKIQQVFLYIEQQKRLLDRPPMKIKTEAPKKPVVNKEGSGKPGEVGQKSSKEVTKVK